MLVGKWLVHACAFLPQVKKPSETLEGRRYGGWTCDMVMDAIWERGEIVIGTEEIIDMPLLPEGMKLISYS